MSMLFEVRNLNVTNSNVKILKNISFEVDEGEVLGIIGESGCGKSTLLRAITKMTGETEKITHGDVKFNHMSISDLSEEKIQKIRGRDIGFVFQNPASTMNPLIKIGKQFVEAINVHKKMNKKECLRYAEELLKKLNLNDAKCILDSYTFELSGGMNQSVAIALAMIMKPKLLICDEPTSALDVTVQAQVVRELISLKNEFNTGMIVVTHSMGVVSCMADKIAVMYAGEIVEYGTCYEILNNPFHPYTKALINSVPKMNGVLPEPIRGNMHSFEVYTEGCRFEKRCDFCNEKCKRERIELIELKKNHFVRCSILQNGSSSLAIK